MFARLSMVANETKSKERNLLQMHLQCTMKIAIRRVRPC